VGLLQVELLRASYIGHIARLELAVYNPNLPIPDGSFLISSLVGSLPCRSLKAFSHALTAVFTVERSMIMGSIAMVVVLVELAAWESFHDIDFPDRIDSVYTTCRYVELPRLSDYQSDLSLRPLTPPTPPRRFSNLLNHRQGHTPYPFPSFQHIKTPGQPLLLMHLVHPKYTARER
jgi:hypothetical protein